LTSPEAELPLVHLEVEDFLAKIADDQPTPGGGSAAALAGAMAAALTCMAARLTLGREKHFVDLAKMREISRRAEELLGRLTALVDEDALAYNGVIAAHATPKGSPTERQHRAAGMQTALRVASEVPLEAAAACVELIELAAEVGSSLGNRSAASDAIVAALLANAGLRGSLLNAHTNLKGLQDDVFVSAAEDRISHLSNRGKTSLARALAIAGLGESTIGA
jgi:methenyltetrahydrofolate cyclohydrolase